jgi:hypothetical protein
MAQYNDLLKKLWHKLMCMLNHIVIGVKCKALGISCLVPFAY